MKFTNIFRILQTTSAILFKRLMHVICRFDFPVSDLCGKRYDGAAKMSGHISGLQNLVREKEKRALYVPS